MTRGELQLSILILEDDQNDATLLLRELKKNGIQSTGRHVDTRQAFMEALQEQPDLVLADYNLPSFGAKAVLELFQERNLDIPVIVITGTLEDQEARECVELGAADYLLKDRLARLGSAVVRVCLERKLRTEKNEAVSNSRRMAAVAEATPDFVGIADSEGKIIYVNRAGRKMTGLPQGEELKGRTFKDLVPARALTQIAEEGLPSALRDGSWSGESTLSGPDGEEIPVSQVIIAHREGADSFFSIVARDMSERMHAENELRRSQGRLQAVWRHSQDAMRLTDREGVIQAVNEPYCRMVGISEQELLGQPFTVVYPEERDYELLRSKHVARFDERSSLIQQEGRTRFRNDEKGIDVEVTILRLDVDSGEDLLLTMIRNISERKELEAQFLRSQRMECIGALAGGIAHDFNNILAPIFMASSMLRMKMAPEDKEKALCTIEESGQRGADVVRRLLLFARGVEGEKKPLDPALLSHEVAALVERSFPRSIYVEERIPSDLWNVSGDGTQLHQVLLNLCVNARDAMPEGGRLVLEARNVAIDQGSLPSGSHGRSGAFVLLTVSDTGAGIAETDLDHIFDPFFSTKAADVGTGLGLSTSLGIIKSHGGFMTVDSKLGEGSRFNVYLPVSGKAEVPSAVEIAPEEESNGRGELILLVDDERLVREVMSKVLAQCGYRTLTAGDGAEALLRLESDGADVRAIVTDVIMPQMDGLQLLRKVRESRPGIPAIAMSGNLDQTTLDGFTEIGVTEIIDKPFRADQLLKAVRAVLE